MDSDSVHLIYVDAEGNEVPEGDPRAVKQYRSDDEARPKPAAKAKAKAPAEDKAKKGPAEDKSAAAPAKAEAK